MGDKKIVVIAVVLFLVLGMGSAVFAADPLSRQALDSNAGNHSKNDNVIKTEVKSNDIVIDKNENLNEDDNLNGDNNNQNEVIENPDTGVKLPIISVGGSKPSKKPVINNNNNDNNISNDGNKENDKPVQNNPVIDDNKNNEDKNDSKNDQDNLKDNNSTNGSSNGGSSSSSGGSSGGSSSSGSTNKCKINCDTNNDGKPDLNIDVDGDGKCDFNCDINGDGKADSNLTNQEDENGVCKLNCDTTGNGVPDKNIDKDNDGKCDLNCDVDNDNKCDFNCDINGDGKPDKNIDTDKDGKPDVNIDVDGDGKCDFNCDTDGDGKADSNLTNQDTNNDGKCDLNCDIDGDGIPDTNVDTDKDGKPDVNVKKDLVSEDTVKKEIKDLINDLDKIRNEENKELIDKIKEILEEKLETGKPIDKETLEDLKNKIEEILANGNISEEERKVLEEILDILNDSVPMMKVHESNNLMPLVNHAFTRKNVTISLIDNDIKTIIINGKAVNLEDDENKNYDEISYERINDTDSYIINISENGNYKLEVIDSAYNKISFEFTIEKVKPYIRLIEPTVIDGILTSVSILSTDPSNILESKANIIWKSNGTTYKREGEFNLDVANNQYQIIDTIKIKSISTGEEATYDIVYDNGIAYIKIAE